MDTPVLARGPMVSIRKLKLDDLAAIVPFEYSVSIAEPHSDLARLREIHQESGMWLADSGAVAIVLNADERMVGTLQFYRSAPCIHGFEIGYVLHSSDDRGKGYAGAALQLLSELLFSLRSDIYRHQLIIEVWNTASWKVAERAGFVREGILRSCGFGKGDPADCFVYSRTGKDHGQAQASHNGPA